MDDYAGPGVPTFGPPLDINARLDEIRAIDRRVDLEEGGIEKYLVSSPTQGVRYLLALYDHVLQTNTELQALFDLQWTRMRAATEAWQKATGRHDTWPDLGDLLTWLLEQAKLPIEPEVS